MNTEIPKQPVLFISHGGGPWPYVDALKQMYPNTESELRRLPARLPARPKAVLVISGHWEARQFSVSTSQHPSMEYDYSGFPAHTYHIRYQAPGDPAVAERAANLLASSRIEIAKDPSRGFDHGVFVPLGLMFPQADMPIVMLSIKSNYNAAEHLALGRALAPLRDEQVLIVGSGLTYHNMQGFGRDSSTAVAQSFTNYLNDAITLSDGKERDQRLLHWESAPQARLAHPHEDHLLPLLAAAGAAGSDSGQVLFDENIMKIPMTSYAFGNIA
jgi:aromatic ring-opening dioxygenase catalytic subunit (LigB family)